MVVKDGIKGINDDEENKKLRNRNMDSVTVVTIWFFSAGLKRKRHRQTN